MSSYSQQQRCASGDHSICVRYSSTTDIDRHSPIALCPAAAELIDTARAVAIAKARLGVGVGTMDDVTASNCSLPDYGYLDSEPTGTDVLAVRSAAKLKGQKIPNPGFEPTSKYGSNMVAFAAFVGSAPTEILRKYRKRLTGRLKSALFLVDHKWLPGNAGIFAPELPERLRIIDTELSLREEYK